MSEALNIFEPMSSLHFLLLEHLMFVLPIYRMYSYLDEETKLVDQLALSSTQRHYTSNLSAEADQVHALSIGLLVNWTMGYYC